MTETTSSDRKPKAGLLPFYIKLYDDKMADKRPRIESFYRQIAEALQARGLDVLTAPVCRLREEFEAAVRGFERRGAQAIVTLQTVEAFGRMMGWETAVV